MRVVLCDLGTDCDDCGPWQPSGPVPWWVGEGEGRGGELSPLAAVRARGLVGGGED